MHSSRIEYLDGLRGVACMMVVAGHYSGFFQPSQAGMPFDDGFLAVAIFFVMSGFVLTESFSPTRYRLEGVLAARIFRLLTPTTMAIVAASGLYLVFQPVAHEAAQKASLNGLWIQTQAAALSELPGDLLASIIGFSNTSALHVSSFISSYRSADTPIWTISYELYGSFLTIVVTRLYHFRRPLWLLAVIASLCTFGFREVGLFVIGHVARLVWYPEQMSQWTRTLLSFGIFAAALCLMHAEFRCDGSALDAVSSGLLPHNSPLNGAHALAGTLVFAIVIYSKLLQRILSWRPFFILGRLSFSIYLIHWPIMLGFGSSLYLLIGSRSPIATWLIFGAGATITTMLAVLFERYIDAPAVALSRQIRNLRLAAKSYKS